MSKESEWQFQLSESSKRFIEVVEGIDAAAFVAKPSGGGPWSVSEVVEHVAIANGSILGVLSKRLEPMNGPADVTDDEMPYLFYGGEEPPNVGTPTGAWTDIDDALGRLGATTGALRSWEAEATFDLRSQGARHPAFGMLDAAQWLRFSAVHTWRHRTQVKAVRRALGA
jgi:uncharacterized damage-inducible protein DinB